MKKSTQQL